MLIYIEKEIKNDLEVKRILNIIDDKNIIYIDDYKNVFYENNKNIIIKKSITLSKIKSSITSRIPKNYGHTDNGYFFKTSLNCIYDCSYCYLKGANKNENIILFVNNDEIIEELKNIIISNKLKETLWFYSSDYSDILALNHLTNFVNIFIPFFEKFENVMMEIRTKSSNIKALLKLGFIPNNTEIAFSLNPQELITKYEKGTSNLDDRIKAINTLIKLGFKVGLRFIPLLPVKNYEKIYSNFLNYLSKKIDLEKIYSVFIGGLLYTKEDYNKIFEKNPNLDILHMLFLEDDNFYKEIYKTRVKMYKFFFHYIPKARLCFDKI